MSSDYQPDPTEGARKELVQAINLVPGSREDLEQKYGKVYDTQEMQAEVRVHGFMAPFISCTRKSDGVKGIMMFQHSPRFYWGFEAITP